MNYSQIKSLALSYADREDNEVINRIPDFLLMVESRINRSLRVREMTVRTSTPMKLTLDYYGLPKDFASIRDIQIKNEDGTGRESLILLNPDQMNSITTFNNCTYYAITANQLHIQPPKDEKVLELIYYKKVIPLTETANTNWISEGYPDVYICGLMVEISSFIKNASSAMLWNDRFAFALEDVSIADSRDRWSGTPITIKAG